MGHRIRPPPSAVLLESPLLVLADSARPPSVGIPLPLPLTSAPRTVVALPRMDHPECMLSSGWKLTLISSSPSVPSALMGCNKTECSVVVSSETSPH